MAEKTKLYVLIFIVIVLLTFSALLSSEYINLKSRNRELSNNYDNLSEKYNEVNLEPGIFLRFYEWGQSAGYEDKYLFKMYLYNFGEEEVKNPEVKCNIYRGDREVKSKVKTLNNIASKSNRWEEIYLDYNGYFGGDITGRCFVVGCDNCRILRKEIDEELYEVYG